MDDGRHAPCCQTVSPDVLETDAQEFNCDTCVVRQRFDGLDPENAEAWGAFQTCATRFCVESRSTGAVLTRIGESLETEAFADLVARISLIYDGVVPVRRSGVSDGA